MVRCLVLVLVDASEELQRVVGAAVGPMNQEGLAYDATESPASKKKGKGKGQREVEDTRSQVIRNPTKLIATE